MQGNSEHGASLSRQQDLGQKDCIATYKLPSLMRFGCSLLVRDIKGIRIAVIPTSILLWHKYDAVTPAV